MSAPDPMRFSPSRRSNPRQATRRRPWRTLLGRRPSLLRRNRKWDALKPVLGGEVGDARATTDALIGLGEGCPNGGLLLAFGAHAFAVASCIGKFAEPEIVKSLLPRLQTGTLIGALAATEAEAGSDVMAMKTSYAESETGYHAARREDLHLQRRAGRYLSRLRHQGCAPPLAGHLAASWSSVPTPGVNALRK